MTDYLEIGQIVNIFGIKGMVKVKPFTDDCRRFDNPEEINSSPEKAPSKRILEIKDNYNNKP